MNANDARLSVLETQVSSQQDQIDTLNKRLDARPAPVRFELYGAGKGEQFPTKAACESAKAEIRSAQVESDEFARQRGAIVMTQTPLACIPAG